jgi:hypothetical protein
MFIITMGNLIRLVKHSAYHFQYFLDLPADGNSRFRSANDTSTTNANRRNTNNSSKHFRRKKTSDTLENSISCVKIDNGHIHAWQAMNSSIDIDQAMEVTSHRNSL